MLRGRTSPYVRPFFMGKSMNVNQKMEIIKQINDLCTFKQHLETDLLAVLVELNIDIKTATEYVERLRKDLLNYLLYKPFSN